MHSFGIFSIFFIISCGYFRVYASAELNIVAPANLNRETELRDISTRSLFLHENQAREIANMLLAKNVSIFIEFSQELHNKGTLLAVYGNNSKVFELFSEGLKGELRASWRRGLRLANLNIQNIELDDNVWHKIIFDLHGNVMRLSVDCEITSVSGQYPEIDFGLLSRTRPTVWVGQRHVSQALLVGRIRQFKVKPDSFYFEECLKNNLNKLEVAAPMLRHWDVVRGGPFSCFRAWILFTSFLTSAITCRYRLLGNIYKQAFASTYYMVTNLGGLLNNKTNTTSSNDKVEDSALMEQLKQKLKRLETEVSKWRPQQQNAQSGKNGNVSNVTAKAVMSIQDEPDGSQGDCPNCYAYLRHKVNYLEQEFKKWRETVQKVENNLKRVLLVQRGCLANNVYYGDGDRWQTDDCIECICNLGKPMCKPIGCLPLTCPRPVKVVGQCCPVCKAECKYMDKTYHDGQTFWPKSCVRCQCRDGDVSCAHQDALKCPKLHCPKEQQATPPEECCPLCVNSSCQPNPCHADAVCQPFNFGVSCRCKAGFFGDGRACFDIDECQLRGGDANDGLTADGPCGTGARCINTNGGYHCECLPGYTKTANRTGCFDTIVPI